MWISTLLVNLPDIRLIVPGGIVRPGETSMVGELSHRAFEIFHVGQLFMGVGGVDANAGLTDYNWDNTLVKQAMIKNAKHAIPVADRSKFELMATVEIAPLETMNIQAIEQSPPSSLAEALAKANVKVILAE